MGYGLYFAFVQHKSGLDERFPVTGGAGIGNMGCFRKQRIDLFHGADRGF